MTSPYGTTVFCDDIRNEVGGKTTLVGCYGTVMQFSSQAPNILPIFGCYISLDIPALYSFNELTVVVRMEIEDTVSELFSTRITKEDIDSQAVDLEKSKGKEDKVLALKLPVRISPLNVKGDGYIKVRARFDDKDEIKLGSLKLQHKKLEETES